MYNTWFENEFLDGKNFKNEMINLYKHHWMITSPAKKINNLMHKQLSVLL